MLHFTVRKRVNGPQVFQNAPQAGEKIFYHMSTLGTLIEDNTVIDYEVSLYLSYGEFLQLIRNITGRANPTFATHKYNYHLDKGNRWIDINYCTNVLGLPNIINRYTLTTIGIAANYKNTNADGNILFIFLDNNNQNNEVSISIHIKYSYQNTNYLNKLRVELNSAANQLQRQNHWVWQLNPWDNFDQLGYIVTKGNRPELAYKLAYEQQLPEREIGNQIANLFN